MSTLSEPLSQNLDHLGLVAAMYDELGIGEVLDQLIVQDHSQRHVSIGQAVKAMVLNGLGFVNRALYLFPDFFADKPTERLIAPGVLAEHLNDDVLGRALDQLYENDVTSLFSMISARSCKVLGLQRSAVHLDSTSFHTEGSYDQDNEEGTVEICAGYSKDHRPDLNQIVLDLIVENKAGIPLLMKPLSGNTSDKVSFGEVIDQHIHQLTASHPATYWVADSALYSAANLHLLKEHHCKWITRVPETLALAQEECAKPGGRKELIPGYEARRVEVEYAGIKQRWLVIISADSIKRGTQSACRKLEAEGKKELAAFKTLCKKEFACEADAQQELQSHLKGLSIITIQEPSIVFKQGKKKEEHWKIEGSAASHAGSLYPRIVKEASFIIATNECDTERLSDEEVLTTYKDQQQVEKGFRFLKDPRFQAHTLFLKSVNRVTALLMVMTLCLLVYAALEYRLRESLKAHSSSVVPDQKGKPTKKPTMRWVFQFFTGIHILRMDNDSKPLVLNIKESHRTVIKLLGESYQKMYI